MLMYVNEKDLQLHVQVSS